MLLSMLPVLAMASSASGQADGSFWWLNNKKNTTSAPVVGALETSAPEEVYCECVQYYLCVEGVINTAGVGVLDVRSGVPRPVPVTNVETCPGVLDVCCKLPGFNETTSTTTTTTTAMPTLPPDTPCECMSFINCSLDKMVHNGGGNTSLELPGLGEYSHSQCPQALAVCCAIDPTTTTTAGPFPPLPGAVGPDTFSSTACECVDAYLCGPDGHIISNGMGLLDIRSGARAQPIPGGECDDPLQVCCRPPKNSHVQPINPGSSTVSSTTTTTTTTTTPPPTTTAEPARDCGARNSDGVRARILGFREGESQFGEFPWVATIVRRETLMGKVHHLFVGGATLIHPRVVVTAAHKVQGLQPDKLVVRLGEWDTQSTLEAFPHQDRVVQEMEIHPRYNPRALFHDVALLFLKNSVELAPHIGTICLAESWDEVDPDGCVINGFGKDGFEDQGNYQKIMKSLTLPLVESRECQDALRTTRLGRFFRLHDSFICAGGVKGKDACKGDGGGPLACPRIDDPTRYLLMGITAWGIGCGDEGVPGVYVNVPAHAEWIKQTVDARFPTTTTSTTTTTTTTTDEYSEFQQGESDYDYEEWEERRRKKKRKGKKYERTARDEIRMNRREERKRRRQMRMGERE
ncbi:phenoloxidase-activating factor 2-like [Penaeus japonicus]|uniref:phenoloxidase-activating factor 2-like n=1 Tax=Penaeus japonicus TaxID=27405 RepID=UPI001C714C26|nr:phenoloxidase-activating factor 2-like [Penaeus japonicus]